MIQFFRRIRRRLLASNNLSKYLVYAIGEILLVVFGILIALQINNWNNDKLERLEEIEILASVKNDLENMVDEFEYLNTIRDKVLYGTEQIFLMANTGVIDEPLLDSLLGLTIYRPTFNSKLGTIDLLFSSGKISLIQNDTIRELLIYWPGSIDDMIEEEVYAVQLFRDQYYPSVIKYAVIDDLMEYAFSTSFFGSHISELRYADVPIEKDYPGLLRDRYFLNHLRMRASHLRITNGEISDLVVQARDLIALIDREVGR